MSSCLRFLRDVLLPQITKGPTQVSLECVTIRPGPRWWQWARNFDRRTCRNLATEYRAAQVSGAAVHQHLVYRWRYNKGDICVLRPQFIVDRYIPFFRS